ncbi:hypothetical protein ACFPU1_04540 [Thalassorhabdus alkalitolerans]|uniref:Uncharacterized protein n=1 Tax=Thalassorhabdus alkalitolerans TaxID=2282697 RepID=A0ABW0YKX8_9BACI
MQESIFEQATTKMLETRKGSHRMVRALLISWVMSQPLSSFDSVIISMAD